MNLTRTQEKQYTVAYVLVFVILSLPIWKYTTAVYRANIPYSKIQELATKHYIDMDIYIGLNFIDANSALNTKEVASKLQKNVNDLYIDYYQSQSRHAKDDDTYVEAVARLKFTVEENMDLKVETTTNGKYLINIACNSARDSIYIKQDRSMLVTLRKCETKNILHTLTPLLSGTFSQEQKQYFTKREMLPYSLSYQLTFSMLNANPEEGIVHWDVDKAIASYIQGFVHSVEDVSRIVVDAQVLHYTSLPIKPRLSDNGSFILKADELPLFIDSAEWNLASVVKSAPPINFLLYIPEQKNSPLNIIKRDGSLSSTNAFLIPRWGGIRIFNKDQGNLKLAREGLKESMEVFLSQLRDLLGIFDGFADLKSILGNDVDLRVEKGSSGITKWELDSLIRRRMVSVTSESINTLQSLSTLIQEIENMVVHDSISDYVTESMSSINQVLFSNSSYEDKWTHGKIAIEKSTKAFFDPSLVSLLYFPAEHVYAVYIPFFVPALVPIFVSFVKLVRKR